MSYRYRKSVAPLVALVAGLACSAPALGQIEWRTAPDGILAIETPAQITRSIQTLAQRPNDRRVVVEFARALSLAERRQLAQAGLTTLDALGGGAYFASLDADKLDSATIMGSADVRRVRAVDSNWKLHEALAAGTPVPWAVVSGPAENPTIGVYVQFHQDEALDADTDRLIEQYAGTVRDVLVGPNALVVEIPRDRIAALAAEDAVQWIEPALPRFDVTAMPMPNNENRTLTEVDTVQDVYGLDGTGVNVLVYDGALARASHSFFAGRLTTIDSSGVISHATHVAATVGGSGVPGSGNHRGMAPNATLYSAGFEYNGSGTFLYTNPGDIEQDFGLAINTYGVVVTNASLGTNTETNGFDCSFQGQYGLTDAVIDQIALGSLGSAPTIVWAAGNERQGSRCDNEGFGDYYSSAPPAGAKNHLCIGAVNANDDSMTSFSSWGPTDDGRMKPDFCAPGCQSNGDGGVTSASATGDTSITSMCGTSMASPTACGIVALMIEDYRNQFTGRPDLLNSTIKALLAHSAVDRGNVGPDYQYGYGSIRATSAIDQMRLDSHQEFDIEQGEVRTFYFAVAPGESTVKVTAAWADEPGAVNGTMNLVNDVDIRLVSPSGTTYNAWTLNPLNPSAPAVRTAPNRLDNLEQVLVDNPESGLWACEVVGHSVPAGPQTVSLVGPEGMAERGVRIQVASVPSLVDPGTILDANVTVIAVEDTLIANSVMLHARNDGGAFVTTQLTSLGGDSYTAELPAALCDDNMEFFITAEGIESGVVTSPSAGENGPISVTAGIYTTSFADAFEADLGWAVVNDPGLADGAWERGTPAGGGVRGDPANDYDGSGQCYLTDNVAGNSDVDGGATTLVSPVFDGTDGDAYVNYARWYNNAAGGNPNVDTFVIEISNDAGGSWTNLESVGPTGVGTSGGWFYVSHRIADYVAPTSNMQVRFIASDVGLAAVVEAALDAFEVTSFSCVNPDNGCPADLTEDGTLDFFDVQAFLTYFAASDPRADFTDDGIFDFFDVLAFLEDFAAGCP